MINVDVEIDLEDAVRDSNCDVEDLFDDSDIVGYIQRSFRPIDIFDGSGELEEWALDQEPDTIYDEETLSKWALANGFKRAGGGHVLGIG
jgi:hypothetical protein